MASKRLRVIAAERPQLGGSRHTRCLDCTELEAPVRLGDDPVHVQSTPARTVWILLRDTSGCPTGLACDVTRTVIRSLTLSTDFPLPGPVGGATINLCQLISTL
jgi:hypothetical protein